MFRCHWKVIKFWFVARFRELEIRQRWYLRRYVPPQVRPWSQKVSSGNGSPWSSFITLVIKRTNIGANDDDDDDYGGVEWRRSFLLQYKTHLRNNNRPRRCRSFVFSLLWVIPSEQRVEWEGDGTAQNGMSWIDLVGMGFFDICRPPKPSWPGHHIQSITPSSSLVVRRLTRRRKVWVSSGGIFFLVDGEISSTWLVFNTEQKFVFSVSD